MRKSHECEGKGCPEPTPAIPPQDYSGSQAGWMVGLQTRGLWDGKGFHGDVTIRCDQWWSLLDECEGVDDE